MIEALTRILLFALGIIISPLPVIVALLIAGSRRRFSNGPAFLGGWFIGLLILVLLFSVLGAGVGGGEVPAFIPWINLVLGLFLWWLAWREWRNRNKEGLPAWAESVDDLRVRNAALFGFLLATIVNPKNIPLSAAMGAVFAKLGLGLGSAVIIGIIFTIVSSASIALAVGLPLTKSGGRVMNRLKDWLIKRTTVIMVPLFIILGVFLVGGAIQSISAA